MVPWPLTTAGFAGGPEGGSRVAPRRYAYTCVHSAFMYILPIDLQGFISIAARSEGSGASASVWSPPCSVRDAPWTGCRGLECAHSARHCWLLCLSAELAGQQGLGLTVRAASIPTVELASNRNASCGPNHE
jgi:hypothetical protein